MIDNIELWFQARNYVTSVESHLNFVLYAFLEFWVSYQMLMAT